MAIDFEKNKRIFSLHTKNTTYQFMVDPYGYLIHLYYGKHTDSHMDYIITHFDRGFSGNPYDAAGDRTYSLDVLPQEFPTLGTGDYRNTALVIQNADGSMDCDLRYQRYAIAMGKYRLDKLPAVYADENAQTLDIVLKDARTGIEVTLRYGVIEACDVITRSVIVKNTGNEAASINRIYSACLDFLYGKKDCISFYGRHAMERNFQRKEIEHGTFSIGSHRGTSSHQYNPMIIIADKETTETSGDAYAMSFVYSGGFDAKLEKDQFNQIRALMGVSDEMFSYPLQANEVFTAPEVVLSYSPNGLSELSQNLHHCIREHICRGTYKNKTRPVLVNSWEAAYFDFDGKVLCALADKAAELGVEMLVMDDGWFGKRNDDNSSLGDWIVNEEKLGCSLKELADRIHAKGLQFGIWMEPEMVSEKSELYKKNPHWAMKIPGKNPVRSRNQLVLDFANPAVVDYIYDSVSKVLRQANINYVKWDMNRSLHDVFSSATSYQGKVLFDYVLGLYDLLERLTTEFPAILWEGCSGGGGRFDMGMLYYTPQIWCSDNTDAIDRTRIQYGTSFGYPLSTMASHVSAVPNHQTGRTTNIDTRGIVAMTGAFGYELDLNKLSCEDQQQIKTQIKKYHEVAALVSTGDYYRLSNPFQDEYGAWIVVDSGKESALLSVVMLETHGNMPVTYVKLTGLQPEYVYQDRDTGMQYTGLTLMESGLPVSLRMGEYQAYQWHFTRAKKENSGVR